MDTKEKYEFSKIYLSEYCHFDGEDDIKFIVIDINLDKSVITCMLNKTGKFQTVATKFDFFACLFAFPVFDYAVILRHKQKKNQKLNPNKTQVFLNKTQTKSKHFSK